MSEAVQKTLVGRCTEISERSGWVSFHIDHGTQYPTKVATKKESVIAEGRSVGGETATWQFGESESDKINEHTGTPFVNRYLNTVTLGDNAAQQAATAPAPAPSAPAPVQTQAPTAAVGSSQTAAHPPMLGGDKDAAITRMACLKAASALYAGKGADTKGEATSEFPVWQDEAVTLTIAAASRFETWVMRDITEVPF
jgi:hypothetical protein